MQTADLLIDDTTKAQAAAALAKQMQQEEQSIAQAVQSQVRRLHPLAFACQPHGLFTQHTMHVLVRGDRESVKDLLGKETIGAPNRCRLCCCGSTNCPDALTDLLSTNDSLSGCPSMTI